MLGLVGKMVPQFPNYEIPKSRKSEIMKSEIKFGPAFATLFVTLDQGDSLVAESGAMSSMSSNVNIATRFNGGFFRALLRKLFGGGRGPPF